MGGGGGDSQTQKIDQTSTRRALEEQQPFIQRTLEGAEGVLGQSFVGNQPLVAGSNRNIDVGQAAALQAAQAQQGLVGQQQNIFNQLAGFGDPARDSVLQQRLADIGSLSTRNLQENILPSLRTGAVQAGQTGSSRQGIAEGIAARGASEAATRAQTQLLGQAEQQRQAALGQALGFSPQLLQSALTPAQTQLQVGQQQRALQQELLKEPLLRQQAELQRLGGLSNIVSQQTSPFGTTTTKGTTTSGASGGGGIGGAVGALGGAAIGGLFGGPAGAALGSGLGGQVGSLF